MIFNYLVLCKLGYYIKISLYFMASLPYSSHFIISFLHYSFTLLQSIIPSAFVSSPIGKIIFAYILSHSESILTLIFLPIFPFVNSSAVHLPKPPFPIIHISVWESKNAMTIAKPIIK